MLQSCAWCLPDKQTRRTFTRYVTYFFLAYSCLAGSLLSIFVPQQCTTRLQAGSGSVAVDRDCTADHLWKENRSTFNIACLALNVFTAFSLIVGFVLETRRDHFVLNHFSLDPEQPLDNLEMVFSDRSESSVHLRRRLQSFNRAYFNLFAVCAVLFLFNAAVSGVLVFYYFYRDYVRCHSFTGLCCLSLPPPPTHTHSTTLPSPTTEDNYYLSYQHLSGGPAAVQHAEQLL